MAKAKTSGAPAKATGEARYFLRRLRNKVWIEHGHADQLETQDEQGRFIETDSSHPDEASARARFEALKAIYPANKLELSEVK